MGIFDLQCCGGCSRPKKSYLGAHFGTQYWIHLLVPITISSNLIDPGFHNQALKFENNFQIWKNTQNILWCWINCRVWESRLRLECVTSFICLIRLSRRKRGMASNPLFIIIDFFCVFPMNFAMATLGLKEMGKFLREGWEKSLPSWLS